MPCILHSRDILVITIRRTTGSARRFGGLRVKMHASKFYELLMYYFSPLSLPALLLTLFLRACLSRARTIAVQKRTAQNIAPTTVQLLRSNKTKQHCHAKRAFTTRRVNKRRLLCQHLNPRHPLFPIKPQRAPIDERSLARRG